MCYKGTFFNSSWGSCSLCICPLRIAAEKLKKGTLHGQYGLIFAHESPKLRCNKRLSTIELERRDTYRNR
eukprot:c34589_g1_i1 orf=4-213(-)